MLFRSTSSVTSPCTHWGGFSPVSYSHASPAQFKQEKQTSSIVVSLMSFARRALWTVAGAPCVLAGRSLPRKYSLLAWLCKRAGRRKALGCVPGVTLSGARGATHVTLSGARSAESKDLGALGILRLAVFAQDDRRRRFVRQDDEEAATLGTARRHLLRMQRISLSRGGKILLLGNAASSRSG